MIAKHKRFVLIRLKTVFLFHERREERRSEKKIIDEFVSMSYHSLHIQYINLRRPTYFESVLIPVLIYIQIKYKHYLKLCLYYLFNFRIP